MLSVGSNNVVWSPTHTSLSVCAKFNFEDCSENSSKFRFEGTSATETFEPSGIRLVDTYMKIIHIFKISWLRKSLPLIENFAF
jgi:hypothetical protein